MSGNTSAPDIPVCGHDSVRQRVQAVLRAAQAAGWTDDALSDASGVSARCIKSYRVEGKEPSLANALSLACVIGPRAINPILNLIGYQARPLDEADEAAPGMIVATLLKHSATIAAAAADGRFDHIEEPECREAADGIIASVLPLSSAGAAE